MIHVKARRFTLDGERKGRLVKSVAQVIEATGVKQKPKDDSAQTIFAELCEEMADVVVSLSRDVISVGCVNRERAMRLFSLLEKISDGER